MMKVLLSCSLVLSLLLQPIPTAAEWFDDASPASRSLFLKRICNGRLASGNTDAFGTKKPPQHKCDKSVGTGRCLDSQNRLYDFCGIVLNDISLRDCQKSAERLAQVVGVTYDSATQKCYAYWQDGATKAELQAACPKADSTFAAREGTGTPTQGDGIVGNTCYACAPL